MSEEKESGNLIVNEKVEKSNLEQWYTDSGETDPELLERRRLVAICWNQKNMSVAARIGQNLRQNGFLCRDAKATTSATKRRPQPRCASQRTP